MKRGASGLSLVVAVDKPQGMTSHDVVGAARRIFDERRVGHAGTLDPLATGVLLVLVGPASRLNDHLSGHDKSYVARIAFGCSTDTDDAAGTPVRTCAIPDEVADGGFARSVLQRFTGPQTQLPPVFSALKRGGKKACDEARRGNVIELEPRDVIVHAADLVRIDARDDAVFWDVAFTVSKGTYIRSLARDIGRTCGSEAHLAALQRTVSGAVTLDECVSLETLAEVGVRAAIDPVRALGYPICFVESDDAARVRNGAKLSLQRAFHRYERSSARDLCACTSGVCSCAVPADGEAVSVVAADRLLAIYRADAAHRALTAETVFQEGVSRGRGL